MKANWGVNAILGFIAFLLTYIFSFMNNTLLTSLIRAGIGFLLFFIVGNMLQLVLQHMVTKKNSDLVQQQNEVETSKVGDGKSPIEKVELGEQSFQSLPLDLLHNGDRTLGPEKIAKAIQTWTSENQEG
ncbi:hypothetical protein [Neobacillus ginsengisoli]|uniref:Uncharacterized protein n=1 Tax=Neobacillus ginsengisoli TaxID=904295 RepID=A0ABT9XVD9_9BACI|nr:hypothetical protein [Neobacillus ginsengisoli]MDQ0199540.1 hypothetical protein [Neobacillus ginsengisoli]